MLTTRRARVGPVAIGRVLLALGAALTSIEGAAHLTVLRSGVITTPVAGWLPEAGSVPPGPWFAAMVLATAGLLLGAITAPSAAVLASGHALLLATDLQLYSNHRVLLVLLCTWFVFAQSDRSWSLRARLRPEKRTAEVPWWPQLLIVASVSSCYLFAGLSKLNPEFLSGSLIASMAPAWTPAQLAAYATPPVEIAIAVGLWLRRTRWAVLVLGVGLHASITVLLGSPLVFGAFTLLCLSAYPLIGIRRTPATELSGENHGAVQSGAASLRRGSCDPTREGFSRRP